MKLVKMWETRVVSQESGAGSFAVDWFENRLNEVKVELEGQFKEFRLSESLKTIYSLIWDDFCSWYLEWVKPPMNEPIDKAVYEKTVDFFEELMQLLHPFMPFVTEEIYHELKQQDVDLTVKKYQPVISIDETILQNGVQLKEAITAIRDARVKNELKNKDTIRLNIETANSELYKSIETILAKQVNAEKITYNLTAEAGSFTVVGKEVKFYIKTDKAIDTSAQKAELQKDLTYQQGFLASVEKKLSNEKFVANAKPEVIDIERKKKADAEAKIKVIEESLTAL